MDVITITPAFVEGLRKEHKEALKIAEAANARVAHLAKKIEGAMLFLPSPGADAQEPAVSETASEGDDNMTAAIEEIANEGPSYTHAEMRAKLRKLGFPEDRLGNYYYTAVHRLKRRERIAIGADKKIGPVF